jgi:hypothetical protein
MKILTATVTDVPIGHLMLPGLMAEDDEFYVGIPQIVDLDLIPPNRSSKQLQALSGIEFQTHKLKTELHPKAINAIALLDFGRIVVAFAKTGNIAAQSLRDDLVGLSLQQLFSDAFKVKFEEEERQQFLKWRQITRLDFHPVLTGSIQRNVNPKPSEWAKYIKQFQDSQGVESGTRDKLSSEKLARLAMAQNTAAVLLDAGLPWDEVLDRIAA